jgi:hypothetical protein
MGLPIRCLTVRLCRVHEHRPRHRVASSATYVLTIWSVLTGCSAGGLPVSEPVGENLTFTGQVAGHVINGVHPETADDSNPESLETDSQGNFHEIPPASTQCHSFSVDALPDNDFVGVVVGQMGASRYGLNIEVSQGDPAYTNPGTPVKPGDINDDGSVVLYQLGTDSKWQQVAGPAGQDPAIITMNPDRTSGTVDAWLEDAKYSQHDATPTIHVSGDWRCGT